MKFFSIALILCASLGACSTIPNSGIQGKGILGADNRLLVTDKKIIDSTGPNYQGIWRSQNTGMDTAEWILYRTVLIPDTKESRDQYLKALSETNRNAFQQCESGLDLGKFETIDKIPMSVATKMGRITIAGEPYMQHPMIKLKFKTNIANLPSHPNQYIYIDKVQYQVNGATKPYYKGQNPALEIAFSFASPSNDAVEVFHYQVKDLSFKQVQLICDDRDQLTLQGIKGDLPGSPWVPGITEVFNLYLDITETQSK